MCLGGFSDAAGEAGNECSEASATGLNICWLSPPPFL